MRRKKKRRWTDAENEKVLAMDQEDTFLADEIHRSVFAIQKQRERLKMKGEGEPLQEWEMKMKLVGQGNWKRQHHPMVDGRE